MLRGVGRVGRVGVGVGVGIGGAWCVVRGGAWWCVVVRGIARLRHGAQWR